MRQRPGLSSVASLADPIGDGRLRAPSAERNLKPITDLLIRYAPQTGQALEIASGTGQHAVGFATALPGLCWQPTERDPARRTSIDIWAAMSGLDNIRPALALDATEPGWANDHPDQNLIMLVNLLHLISAPEARVLISEVCRALTPGGLFVLYGPFLRNGVAISDGDQQFDANLRAGNPDIGYKNDADIRHWLTSSGLVLTAELAMPANNLCFVTQAPPEKP